MIDHEQMKNARDMMPGGSKSKTLMLGVLLLGTTCEFKDNIYDLAKSGVEKATAFFSSENPPPQKKSGLTLR